MPHYHRVDISSAHIDAHARDNSVERNRRDVSRAAADIHDKARRGFAYRHARPERG